MTSTASSISPCHGDRLCRRVIVPTSRSEPGNYYSAADEGLFTTYYAQLRAAGIRPEGAGYPEYYLNVQSPKTVSIIESMIDKRCAGKAFDAVETDIDEEYTDNSGFELTRVENRRGLRGRDLADYMHGLGLGWWIKNPTTPVTTPRPCTRWQMPC